MEQKNFHFLSATAAYSCQEAILMLPFVFHTIDERKKTAFKTNRVGTRQLQEDSMCSRGVVSRA